MKRCAGCGETKPLGDFSRRTASPDGAHYACRACICQRNAATYVRYREERAERARRYRQEDPERARASNRSSYAKFAGRRRQYRSDYVAANPLKVVQTNTLSRARLALARSIEKAEALYA